MAVPFPVMVKVPLLVMLGRLLVTVNAPFNAKVMVLLDTAAFAAVIASRSEQSASQTPSLVSGVFVTIKLGGVGGKG